MHGSPSSPSAAVATPRVPDGTPPAAPAWCVGDTVMVTYQVSDLCHSTSITRYFGVAAPPAIVINKPDNSYTSTCAYTDQAAINAVYTSWLAQFSVSGGCSPNGTYGTPPNAPAWCAGDTVSVTYTVTSLCVSTSITRYFGVAGDAIPPSLTCPGNVTAVCTPPDPILNWGDFLSANGSASDNCGINTASFAWIIDVSNGQTNPETITRYYRIEDKCGNADTCSQIITVVELQIHAWVYLEGSAIDPAGAQTFTVPMRHNLNDLKVLPGQTYIRQFDNRIIYSQPGQPYNTAPWNYFGNEGYGYDSDSIPNPGTAYYPSTAVDWVLVSLRATLNGDPVCQTAAILLADGTIDFVEGGFSCCDISLTTSYYLIIEHRNHLIIASPTPLPIASGSITFDFRTNQSYIPFPNIFGYVGQKQISSGIFAMYAGNGDQGLLPGASATDLNLDDWGYWYTRNGTVGSYNNADYNMNVDVNYNDRPVWEYNNGFFTSVPRP